MTQIVEEKKKDEDWMQKKWRPAMGWMYMGICTLDMAIFPILWSILQAAMHQPVTQWNPLTLQGAGLFHVAMGAVLGIAAFGRTQEKLAGSANNATTPTPAAPAIPSSVPAAPSFSAPTFRAPVTTPAATEISSAPLNSFPGDPPTRNTRND
jgi:hypothetical protein